MRDLLHSTDTASGRLDESAPDPLREHSLRDPLRDSLGVRALRGELRSNEVDIGETPNVPLGRNEVRGLAGRLSGVGDRSATPVADRLQSGEGAIGLSQVALPAPGPLGSGPEIAESVASMDPKGTRVVEKGDRYDVFAELNPWIRVVGGEIAEVDAQSGWNSAARGGDAAWEFLSYDSMMEHHGVDGHLLQPGDPWPPPQPMVVDPQEVDEEHSDADFDDQVDVHEDVVMAGPAADAANALPTPVRDAFAQVRAHIDGELGNGGLSAEHWQIVADHPVDAIAHAQELNQQVVPMLEALGDDAQGAQPPDFVADLAGPNGASCIPTADRLFGLLGAGNPIHSDNALNMGQQLAALAQAISADDVSGVFRVEFGPLQHGFIVWVDDGNAEIVQSFANSEALATNLEANGFAFPAALVAEHIGNLLDEEETAAAQDALFEGSIDDNGGQPIANMTLNWQRSDLPENVVEALQGPLVARANQLMGENIE